MSGEHEPSIETSGYSQLELTMLRAYELEYYLNTMSEDDDGLTLYAQRAIHELNSMYPYIGERVAVRGAGIVPKRDPRTGLVVKQQWDDSIVLSGKHSGFEIVALSSAHKTKYHILQSIFFEEGTIERPAQETFATETLYQRLSALMSLDAAIVFGFQIDECFTPAPINDPSTDLEKQMHRLNILSNYLFDLLSSDNFLKADQRVQQQALERIIKASEAAIPVVEIDMKIEANHCYACVLDGTQKFVPIDVQGIQLYGTCLGLETPYSHVLQTRALTSVNDLEQFSPVLNIILDPDDSTLACLKIEPDQLLYLPTDQNMDLYKL